MTNYTYFHTYEGGFDQPHPDMEGAMSWLRDYDVDSVIEVEYDEDGEMVFAWDRTKMAKSALVLAESLAGTMKTARDYQPKNEHERMAMEAFSAKMPKWNA